ncbi:FAD-binding domain protein [Aspergillus bertholletiae]|uniref:FAD-binding domain protein n=1 Tax=Aspergillus bertholletiae TaxID=1226010 RepID=A0A5N7ANH3_9EURO|nr:FAD-binding domain protein [Aspergillus bertholletiae]
MHTLSRFMSANFRPWWLANLAYLRPRLHFLGIKIILKPQFLIPILYTACTIVFNLVGVHSVTQAGVRAAHISLITLFLLFWASDHEFGARLLGVTLGTYQSIHRISAFMAGIQAVVHVIITTQNIKFSVSDASQFYGLMTGCMFLSLLFLPMVRRRVYEVFLWTHQGCAIFVLYAIWRHVDSSVSKRWVCMLAITCAATGVLQIVRIIFRNLASRNKLVRYTMETLGNDICRVTLLLPKPWKVHAGERVRLSIPQMGLLHIFQLHPFATVWWENDKNGAAVSISLLIRARSGFTRTLLDRSVVGQKGWAWIDGPYGPSYVGPFGYVGEVGDYGHLFMAATGIGIVAQLPYIKEILDGRLAGQVRTQRILLVWQIEQDGDWEAARDWLQALVKQDNGYMLKVIIYNQMESSSNAPGLVGHHDLITIYGGEVNWEQQLSLELKEQIGTLLIMVSTQRSVRTIMMQLAKRNVKQKVELFELEFQPWSSPNNRLCALI